MRSKYALFRFIVTIVSFFVSVGLIRSIWENRDRRGLIEDRQAVLKQEQDRNIRLQEKLREATSPAFIEREAREKLGLARPGDTIVLIGQSEASGSAGVESTDARSNLEKWWGLFF